MNAICIKLPIPYWICIVAKPRLQIHNSIAINLHSKDSLPYPANATTN